MTNSPMKVTLLRLGAPSPRTSTNSSQFSIRTASLFNNAGKRLTNEAVVVAVASGFGRMKGMVEGGC
ncbi:hypothetical protein ACSBR1_036547 [Camellia fascicularis]